MRKLLLSALILAASLPALAQYTTIVGSKVGDANGDLLTSGFICFTGTDQSDRPINYRIGTLGGQASKVPVCAAVTNGVISGTAVNGSAMRVADTTLTSPANICYRIEVKNAAGSTITRYPQTNQIPACGSQPSGSSWDFDTFAPPFTPMAMLSTGPTGPEGPTGPTGSAGTAAIGSGTSLPSPTTAGELFNLTTGKKGLYANRSGSEYTYMFDDLPCVNYVVKADLVYSPSVSGTIDDAAMQACLDAANLYHMNPVVRGPVRLTTPLTWANTGWATVNPLTLKCVGSGAGFWWDGTGSSSTWMLSITAGQPIAIDRCGFQSTGYAKAVNAISVNGAKVFLSDIGCGGGNPLYILDCLKLQNSFVGRVDNLYAYGVLGTAIHAVEANGYEFNGVECYVSGLRCAFFDFGSVAMTGYMQGSLKTVADTAVTSIVVNGSNVASITMAATPAAGSFLTWKVGYRVVSSGASGFNIDCRISTVTDSTHFSCPFQHAAGTATGGVAWQAPAAGIELKNGAQLNLKIDDESGFSSLVGAGYRSVLMDATGALLFSNGSHWCLASCVHDYVVGVGNEASNPITLMGDWNGNGGYTVAFAGPFSNYNHDATATGLIDFNPRRVFGDTSSSPLVSYGAVSGAGYSLNHYNSWADVGVAGNTTPCPLQRWYTTYWVFGCPGGNVDSYGKPNTGTWFADTYFKNSQTGVNGGPLFYYTAAGGTPGTWVRPGYDGSGSITLASATSASYTFPVPYTSAPLCTISPVSDPGALTYWVTSTVNDVTANLSSSGSIVFRFNCGGQ